MTVLLYYQEEDTPQPLSPPQGEHQGPRSAVINGSDIIDGDIENGDYGIDDVLSERDSEPDSDMSMVKEEEDSDASLGIFVAEREYWSEGKLNSDPRMEHLLAPAIEEHGLPVVIEPAVQLKADRFTRNTLAKTLGNLTRLEVDPDVTLALCTSHWDMRKRYVAKLPPLQRLGALEHHLMEKLAAFMASEQKKSREPEAQRVEDNADERSDAKEEQDRAKHVVVGEEEEGLPLKPETVEGFKLLVSSFAFPENDNSLKDIHAFEVLK
ncbi:hypothetical protein MKZ38_002243 [Zalerion maritima]|uniref:Uncharacterized protein n=1 Tax=Zalerion maritima TaxID=339359 RepID=A0AAD5RPW5_9PEZI|nr:hypothetical protein MKZ38_002243 [Zalerion maritima]